MIFAKTNVKKHVFESEQSGQPHAHVMGILARQHQAFRPEMADEPLSPNIDCRIWAFKHEMRLSSLEFGLEECVKMYRV